MSNVTILYTGNDMVLELSNLTNDVTGELLDAADVQVTLLRTDGTPVEGAEWPLSLLHVAGSRGMYRVTLPYTMILAINGRYTAQVTVDAGPGLRGEFELECVARQRG